MKKNHVLCVASILIFFSLNLYGQKDNEIQRNKEIATKYHELNPANIDAILTVNFIGRNEKSRHTWNRENHRKYLNNGVYKVDSIFCQIAEGDWVATRFFRRGEWQGDTVTFEMMHFKRFENGKIAEIWEYGDSGQIKEAEK